MYIDNTTNTDNNNCDIMEMLRSIRHGQNSLINSYLIGSYNE